MLLVEESAQVPNPDEKPAADGKKGKFAGRKGKKEGGEGGTDAGGAAPGKK